MRPEAYPYDLLNEFRRHLWTVWLPERAAAYFAGQDSNALEFLLRLIAKGATATLAAPFKKLPPRPIPKQMRRA